MPALREVQAAFRRALVAGEEGEIAALIAADGVSASERLAVYRNNFEWALTDVLRDTFPVVCRLVDERFFAYAVHIFMRRHPPERACLAEYGECFPDFLADFPPCRELVYLPDVARFEWLMNVAAHAADAEALAPLALAGVAPGVARRLVFRLAPALGFLASRWPVDRIWRNNQSGAASDEAIDLRAGGVHLEVSRERQEVVFRVLDGATFAFREAIARGASLETATAAALSVDDRYDVAAAFAELFAEGAVVAASLTPENIT